MFLVLATLVTASVVAQTWHLVRLLRHGLPASVGAVRAALPLLWELVLAGAALVLYPSLLGGLGWAIARDRFPPKRRSGPGQHFRWSGPLFQPVPPTGFEPALPP